MEHATDGVAAGEGDIVRGAVGGVLRVGGAPADEENGAD